MEQLIHSFLWNGIELKHTGAIVAWADITCPKAEEGLGVKKIEDMNKALMARYIWAVCQPSSCSNWVNWVKQYLIREHFFWELSTPSVCSWTWRKLLSMRELVRPLIYHKIGNGMDTSLLVWQLALVRPNFFQLWRQNHLRLGFTQGS